MACALGSCAAGFFYTLSTVSSFLMQISPVPLLIGHGGDNFCQSMEAREFIGALVGFEQCKEKFLFGIVALSFESDRETGVFGNKRERALFHSLPEL